MMLSSKATTTWNRHGAMYENNTKTAVTKEQHPLRMINDNDGDDDDHSTTSTTSRSNDGDDLTCMHLNANKDHLMQRDDYLQNFLLENSSTAFEELMSNLNKTVTLTSNNNVDVLGGGGNNSWGCNVTICDSSTTRNTATTATTSKTSGGRGRPPLMKKTQHPSNPPRNMDSMPYPIPAIVMSKSESYDALLSSSSSSSSSCSGEMTSETSSSSSSLSASKSQEQDKGERTKDSQSQPNDDENEWYPDSPTTVADVSLIEQQQQQPNGDTTKGYSPKSIPSIDHVKKSHEGKKEAATTTKTKKDQVVDATAAPVSKKSEFLRSQRCLEKKSDFKECFKLFFKGKRGELISPLHDFSLHSSDTPDDITMIVEVPKGSKAKMFVSSHDEYTPIVQDLSSTNQTLKYYDCPFYWNMGFIPQTWQAERDAQRPLGLIDISSKKKLPLGSVTKVKILGALGLIDPNVQGEDVIEWKLICIQVNDPKSSKYHDIHDVPTFIQSGIREWFRWHLTSSSSNGAEEDNDDDEPQSNMMQFAFDEQYQSRSFALKLIEQAHKTWKETS